MEEKTKICPFCREQISILARKCKYCGEMVGDPLQTERLLTVDDIGRPKESRAVHGETLVKAYQALQAELKEKTVAIQKQRRRRRLTELPHANEIAILLVVAGVVWALVAFRGNITDFFRQRTVDVKDAHAVAILKEAHQYRMSGDLVEALKSVKKALLVYPESARAQAMLSEIRAEIKQTMERMYRQRHYAELIRCADQVLSVDPENTEVMMLANLAEDDSHRYSLRLAAIIKDETTGKRVAAIQDSVRGTMNVSEGDRFMEMRVEKIDAENGQVHVFDEKRDVAFRVTKEGCAF